MKIWTQLKKVHNAITYKVYTPLNKIKFLLNGVVYGKNLCVRGNVYIFKHYESGKIIIGDNVIINSASWANPIGCGDRTYFQINEKAVLTIGNNCGISNTAITCEEKVTIEDNVMIGSGCHIYDTDFHPLEYSERVKEYYKGCPTKRKPVRICEGAFIGAGCYILKGVTIGEHAIVGAGSVVAKDIPAGEIWVQLNQREPVVYAAFTKNKATRKNSSSGGMFTELAKSVLEKGGIIYASKLSEDCKRVVFDSCKENRRSIFDCICKRLYASPVLRAL